MAGSEAELPPFDRRFFESPTGQTRIGDGAVGGKAAGLVRAARVVESHFDAARYPAARVDVPRIAVLTADVYDDFLRRNGFDDPAWYEEQPDDRIALRFQSGDLPVTLIGDLRALIEGTRRPLAVRSSSRLEDALGRPFAGVYETKMIPNFRPEADKRFRELGEAIKFVWASTWFRAARDYRRHVGAAASDEQMAVVLQEVVGLRHDDRFYPHLSGVGKSFNFYHDARARPQDGVISLALGLGKTIVDGGSCWSFVPARPKAPPPFASAQDLLRNTQTHFWAVRMVPPPHYDPIAETEYLAHCDLAEADYDDTLRRLASTYDARSDRVTPGTGRDGPRVLDFAPLLRLGDLDAAETLRALLHACEEGCGGPVEIEFAATLDEPNGPALRIGLLQVRPMVVSDERVEVPLEALAATDLLVGSERVMGNGREESVADVVYVRREHFDAALTREIAAEVAERNAVLRDAGRGYVLIGFGRWGSQDPWLGIPVDWSQISAARAIVESTLPDLDVEPSQGSHFFHNLSSFGVTYFMVRHAGTPPVDWDRLDARDAVAESRHVRHVRFERPLRIEVDGRSGRGLIRCPPD